MTSFTPTVSRRAARGLAVLAAAGAAVLGAASASAGGCPAGREGVNQLTNVPDTPVGVTDMVIGQLAVAEQIPEIPGHVLRTRLLTIEPGGVVPFHSHEHRPALIYMLSGEMTEHSTACLVPIVHRPGDIAQESVNVAHWWQNTGGEVATLISSDIVATPDDDGMM